MNYFNSCPMLANCTLAPVFVYFDMLDGVKHPAWYK